MSAIQRILAALSISGRNGAPNGASGNGGGFYPIEDAPRWLRSGNQWECVAAAWACVNLQVRAIRQCPFRMRDERTGELVRVDAPGYLLLARPNPLYDPAQFWGRVWRELISCGNAYVHIVRRGGRPWRLRHVIAATARRPLMRQMDAPIRYDLTFDPPHGMIRDVPASDVLAFHGEGFDGLCSPSPVEMAGRAALAQSAAIQESTTRSARRGWWPWMIAKKPPLRTGEMTPEQERALLDKLNAPDAGVWRMVPKEVEVQAFSPLNAQDVQIVKIMEWTVLDICRVFGVPPRMVYQYTTGTRIAGNFGGQNEDFVKFSIRPHLDVIGRQLTHKLMPDDRLRVELEADEIQRGTLGERMAIAEQGLAASLLTRNEARAILGMPAAADSDEFLPMRGAPGGGDGPPVREDAPMMTEET